MLAFASQQLAVWKDIGFEGGQSLSSGVAATDSGARLWCAKRADLLAALLRGSGEIASNAVVGIGAPCLSQCNGLVQWQGVMPAFDLQ